MVESIRPQIADNEIRVVQDFNNHAIDIGIAHPVGDQHPIEFLQVGGRKKCTDLFSCAAAGDAFPRVCALLGRFLDNSIHHRMVDILSIERRGHLYRIGTDAIEIVRRMLVGDVGGSIKVSVQIDHRAGLDVEVVSGLRAGERVVVSPSDRVADGVPVVDRP